MSQFASNNDTLSIDNNKIVLITGASSGIGLATAERFAQQNLCAIIKFCPFIMKSFKFKISR